MQQSARRISLRHQVMVDAIEACAASGCLIKKHPTQDQLTEYMHAPISLFPTPYPLHLYREVHNYQHPLGVLVSNLTSKPEMISSLLESFL